MMYRTYINLLKKPQDNHYYNYVIRSLNEIDETKLFYVI